MPKPHVRTALLWMTTILLYAGPALATVSENPVRIRLVGGLPVAEPGTRVTLVLELTAKAFLDLNNVSMETDGWDIASPPPPTLHLSPGQPQRITVEVEALDPNQPLRFRYRVGGESYEDYFDVSSRAREAQRPGALTRITDTALIESLNRQIDTQSLRPEPGPQPSLDARSRFEPQGAIDLHDTLRTYSTERDIRIVGYFRYQRPDGQGAGVDGAVARIFDEDTGWDELLAEQTLGPDGHFDVTFHWDPCFTCDGQPDIYVQFNLENSKVNLQLNGTNDTYNWQTGVWGDFGGNYLDVGVNLPNIAWQMPACHIMTQMMRAWRFLVSTGRDCGKIDVQWPDNDNCPTACYRSASQEIHVPSAREWDENTLVHEYGHHFVYSFATGTTPDYCNSICDSPGNCGHCIWCRETDHDAFNEGFPNYFADAVLRTYQSVYGLGPVTTRFDQENLYFCTTTLDDPWTTEGFLGALMVDIDDGAQDDQASQPAGIDEMNLGYDEIINVVDNSAPTTPAGFLSAFKSTYPQQTEALWATARNNGYDIDNFPPGTVSNLGSDHPLNQNWDTRAYITWSWNRPSDDASGVVAYSYIVSTSPPGMPDQTAELANVTSVRTGPHAAGYYYISIRAQDRSGKWSNSYAVAGPYGIRNADPPNLKMQVHTNWANLAIVARHAADVTTFSAQAPIVLYGYGPNSYFSVDYNNAGEQATGQYWVSLFLDSGWFGAVYRFSTPPGVYDPVLNYAAQFPGGRHTVGAFLDETEFLPEPIETDNLWAHQWSWQPATLNETTPFYYNGLQTRYAGTEWVVDGSAIYPNSYGYQVINAYTTNKYWTAVSVHSDSQADYDMFVHSPSTNPTVEFTSTLLYANAGVGATDIILWNGASLVGSYAWDVGLNNYAGGGYYTGTGFNVQKKTNAFLTLPGNSADAFAADEMVRLWQFNCPGGRMLMRLQLDDPTQGPLNLTLVPSTFSYGPLRGAGTTVTTNAGGEAVLDLSLSAGAPCIAVWRDAYQGHAPVSFTISVEPTPADLNMMTGLPGSWAGFLVPRADNTGAPTTVPLPPYLVGDATATWLNYYVGNAGAGAVPGGTIDQTIFLDGQTFTVDTPSAPTPNSKIRINMPDPFNVRGGRHVLGAYADYADLVHEITSTNNFTARQWVWIPAELVMDVSAAFPTPPTVFAGWEYMPSGSPLWFNMNGTRTPVPPGPDPQQNGWRLAVAAMPDPGTDVDLKLFEVATNATNGFDTELAGSYWGPGQLDLCLVDFRNTAPRSFDVGLVAPAVQAGPSRVQIRTSKHLGSVTASPSGPVRSLTARGASVTPSSNQYNVLALNAGDLFDIYEIDFAAGAYMITLVPATGGIAWGMAVYPPGTTYVGKSGSVPEGIVWGGPDQAESITLTVDADGTYAIVVWKNLSTQVDQLGSFTMQIVPLQTGISPEEPPSRPLAVLARPNPFSASTNIAFTLTESRPVDIQIFDVTGRHVRRLSAGAQGAGTHSVSWDGNDDVGRAVPAGFYFVRTTAGTWVDEKKIVRIR